MNIKFISYLNRSIFDNLVSQGRLVKDNLTVDHFIDWLGLDVEVEEFSSLNLGVEHVPYLVPGDGHGDGAQEHLLGHGPAGVNTGTTVEVHGVGARRNFLNHKLRLVIRLDNV